LEVFFPISPNEYWYAFQVNKTLFFINVF